MKRERPTSTLTHMRTSSVEFARSMLQSARDEFALVHKRVRGFATTAATAANATPVHLHHHHLHHSHNQSLSHRRHGSSAKAAMSTAAFANPAAGAPDTYNGRTHAAPAPRTTTSPLQAIAPVHVAAAQLQFYGFYATTAFDRSTISPAEALILAAEMAADIYSEASMLYDMLSEFKTPSDEVRAVDELMARMQRLLVDDADAQLPTAFADVTTSQATNVRNVYNGLVRVYVFLFQRYYREFVELDVSELLGASWQRLLAFAAEYRILDEAFILQVNDYVSKLVVACKS